MKYFGNGLSEQHQQLSSAIKDASRWDEARRLFLELHAKLHMTLVSSTNANETAANETGANETGVNTAGVSPNEIDDLLGDITPDECRAMLTPKDETIAWAIWHIARIEDMTMNILVAGGEQIFNGEWKERIGVSISDTGNALSDDEIMELSGQANIKDLILYRNAAGRRTREIISALPAQDLKRKVSAQGLAKIKQEGGVTDQESSLWLLDYWGKKDVAGLLLMPPTRHLMMHLNDCCRWKHEIRQGKKIYRSI